MTQARVNQANKTWELLFYKNERVISFEAFCKKLAIAVQAFDRAKRPKLDCEIINWIWLHVQNSELPQFISALKVGQSLNPRTSQQILQELAKRNTESCQGL